MWRDRIKDWGGTFIAAAVLVIVTLLTVIFVAPLVSDTGLRTALYTGAVTLFFVGLLGGMLKVLLDDVATVKRKREDAGTFVTNVLADLKTVYDRVARARVLIPAHKSVATYGDEMRSLIEARVQLRNVTRALERRAEGMNDNTREEIIRLVSQMEKYIETLTCEFRDNYKPLSDKQRFYEERSKAMLKHFAESEDGDVVPTLPGFVWDSIARLKQLSDFIGEANEYKANFEIPLDNASESLRSELARIVGRRSPSDTSEAISSRN